eukprot:SAG31_NODE_21752_length_541_cov_1.332579_2_plen_103_part_01
MLICDLPFLMLMPRAVVCRCYYIMYSSFRQADAYIFARAEWLRGEMPEAFYKHTRVALGDHGHLALALWEHDVHDRFVAMMSARHHRPAPVPDVSSIFHSSVF